MKKNIYLNCLLLIIVSFGLPSCVQQKQIAYFQKSIDQSDTLAVAKAYVPRIQPGDILSIPVGSLNAVASSFFNPYSTMPSSGEIGTSSSGNTNSTQTAVAPSFTPALTQSSAPGYLVDANGMIEMPLLGTVKIAGLTTSEARDTLKKKLSFYLKEPTVNVRFLNYKISVMGEVLHPGVYVIPNETITLPEALSLAGDMTIFGRRENVLVIRDNNGKKEFGHINLNNREIFSSPYYYLHANDVVYIEPSKGRVAQTDKTYQLLPVILSALSFLSIIVIYSKK